VLVAVQVAPESVDLWTPLYVTRTESTGRGIDDEGMDLPGQSRAGCGQVAPESVDLYKKRLRVHSFLPIPRTASRGSTGRWPVCRPVGLPSTAAGRRPRGAAVDGLEDPAAIGSDVERRRG